MHDYLCSVSLGLLYIFCGDFSQFLIFVLSVLAAAGKSISKMTYFVWNEM